MMKPFPEQPTDQVLAELVAEVCESLSILGRSLGDDGLPETQASTLSTMQPSIAAALVGAYCEGEGVYLPGAGPGIPPQWRTLRFHELSRIKPGEGVSYRFTEYLPDLARLGPVADAQAYGGVAGTTFAALVEGLKKSLGKPKKKQKQNVEFEWGEPGAPSWGGVRLQLGGAKEIKIGGGDSAPWGPSFFSIELMGARRP